ncbi:MAG: cytochrome c [Alphaproteobacteria bacterium]
MRRFLFRLAIVFAAAGLVLLAAALLIPPPTADRIVDDATIAAGDKARGAYVAAAAGCASCHTDARADLPALSGGAALRSPFGDFYPPNITPDRATGIGGWRGADFVRAMTDGLSPAGAHYYPAFPYTHYAAMSDSDLADLWAWLRDVPPVTRRTPPHDLSFPFSVRPLLALWKHLYGRPPTPPAPQLADAAADRPATTDASDAVLLARGRYLGEVLGHCAACHTPRGLLGGYGGTALAGTRNGPGGDPVPAITAAALADWSQGDLLFFFDTGLQPDGDAAGGDMALVIRNTLSRLSDGDPRALAVWLKTGN